MCVGASTSGFLNLMIYAVWGLHLWGPVGIVIVTFLLVHMTVFRLLLTKNKLRSFHENPGLCLQGNSQEAITTQPRWIGIDEEIIMKICDTAA